jgi:CBS domain-containing protein
VDEPVRTILDDKGRQVYRIAPGATVAEAVRAMNEAKVGALVVVEGERPVGIFTERDVLVRVVADGNDPGAMRVGDVMTRQLVVILPTTTVREAMLIVTEKRCRHLPVVEEGRLAGMISIGDLTRWMVRGQQHQIDQLMSYITGGYP